MADKLGEVFYEAHIRGDKLALESRRIGNRAGTILGKEMSKSFGKEVDASVGKRMKNLARDLAKDMDSMGQATNRSRGHLRRWQAIVLAITAAAPEIAVLGSAVGAALVVVGVAALAGVAGLGLFAASLSGLGAKLSTLPKEIRPAAQAFQDFKKSFGELQNQIQLASAGGLTVLFSNLKAVVDGLAPALSAFAAVVANTFATISAGIVPGTAGFEKLMLLTQGLTPIFASLATATASLLGGIGNVFITALPFAQNFADTLGDLFGRFAEWTASAEGILSITGWFENMEIVFAGVADVAGSLGKTLADIVTPDLAVSFASFLGQLADFLPTVGKLIGLVEKLGIFSILGAIFDQLGPVVDQLLIPLGELASTLGGAVVETIKALAPPLSSLVTAISPLIGLVVKLLGPIGELVTTLLDKLAPVFDMMAPLFEELAAAVLPVVEVLLDALMPILQPLVDLSAILIKVALIPLVEVFKVLAPVIQALAPILTFLGEVIGAVIETIVALFNGDFSKVGEIWSEIWTKMVALWEGTLQPFFEQIGSFFVDLWTNVTSFFKDAWSGIFSFLTDIGKNIVGFWVGLWTGISTTFKDIWNGIVSFVRGIWNNIIGFIEGGVNGAINLINGLIKGINSAGEALGIHLNKIPNIKIPRLAAGGIITHRMQAILGEAGPEMVVPLRRNLSQVDPAVRDVSAFAQGLTPASTNGGKTVTFEAGAVQIITPAKDPVLVASMVMDATVARALN